MTVTDKPMSTKPRIVYHAPYLLTAALQRLNSSHEKPAPPAKSVDQTLSATTLNEEHCDCSTIPPRANG